ncbi:hypothetical protein C8R43DRAFT_1132740 [Mycena crocata]|nr:hypothetical protein C8R43DRAFT_1132740 [Mycena crocata]
MSSSTSFKDMLNMPLDSSPVKAPTPVRAATSPPGTPTPAGQVPFVHAPQRKRLAEDMTQYADEVSRTHKLPKTEHDSLREFAQANRSEQMILLAGQIFALSHHQRQLQPAEAAWTLPKKLQNKIEENICKLLADASLPAYKNDKIGPSKLIMDMVRDNPSWGITRAMAEEKSITDAVATHISKTLTSKRNIIKSAISASLGSDPLDGATLRPDATDIVDLANIVLTKLKRNFKADLPFCGRMAVLRKVISENDDTKYWGAIDSQLREVREKYPVPKDQSKFIKSRILAPDLAVYGHVELTSLTAAHPVQAAAGPSTATINQNADDNMD